MRKVFGHKSRPGLSSSVFGGSAIIGFWHEVEKLGLSSAALPCTAKYPDDYFPEKKGKVAEQRAARSLCAGCPVMSLCLDTALRDEVNGLDVKGIWGGRTELERTKLILAAGQGSVQLAQNREVV